MAHPEEHISISSENDRHAAGRRTLDRTLRAAHVTDVARLLTLLPLVLACTIIAAALTGALQFLVFSPNLPTMKVQTATAICLLSTALLARSRAGTSRFGSGLIAACCGIASIIAVSALIEHLPTMVLTFDDFFGRERSGSGMADRFGLMSPAAALCIVLLSIATVSSSWIAVVVCCTVAIGIASGGGAAFVLNAGGIATVPFFSSLAAASAFSLVLLGSARLTLLWRDRFLGGVRPVAVRPMHATILDTGFVRFVIPLLLGLVATAGMTTSVRTNAESEARARFERLSENLVRAAERRINLSVYGLKGLRGVYAVSDVVERSEFAAYVMSRELETEFPGVTGMGLIERVALSESDAFVTREKLAQGADFSIKSSGTLDPMYVIRFIEPLAANLPAWGYDVGSEAHRRAAIEQAIDTGNPTITHPITLVQDAHRRIGFLYLVPLYHKGSAPTTVEERRRDLRGVLYAPIILEKVLAGFTGDVGSYLDFEIFDGTTAHPKAILFDLDKHLSSATEISASRYNDRMFWATSQIRVGGRDWTIVTSTTSSFEATVDSRLVALVAMAGALVSVLMAFILWSSSQTRGRALSLAIAMNADLQRLALVAERTTNAVVITDARGYITWVNDGFTRLTGYAPEEVAGRKPGSMLQCERTNPDSVAQIREAIRCGTGCRVELVNRGKHGREYSLELDIQPIRESDGTLSGFIAIESDVTERVEQRDSLKLAKEAAEAALREARALRATIDEHAIVSVADASGKITDANPAFCEISGYTLPELLGQDHQIVNSGHHPKKFWVEMWKTIAVGRPWRGEVCNRAKDGSLYWVDSMIAPFRDADGRIVKYVSIRTDITARKRAEASNARSSQLLRRTGQMARVGGWELDVATMMPIWSEEVYAIHEVDPGTPIELAAAVKYYPDDAEQRIGDAVQNAIRQQTAFDLVLPFTTAKGNHLWVRAQGEPVIENGKVTRLVGAFQDITQEVTQKLRAEEQAERVELTVRSGGLGTWDWNCVTGEVVFNDIWATMLGYQPGEIEGHVRSWERLVHPDDMATVMRVLTEHLEGRSREYRCEHRLLRRDGTWAWVLDSGMVIKRDETGKPLRAAGVHIDITKAKELELTLSEAKRAAEAATQTKSEFLANMSHEIRTPLTAILGYADILREEGDVTSAPAHRIQTIDTIRSAGQHLLTVINDILDLSKIEAGKMTVETIETPLVHILHEVQSMMGPRARGKGVALSTRFESAVPDRIQCDPTRLRQILMNLVGNAAKFTEAGSITTIVRTEGDRLIIDIDDTGPGMTADQSAKLFAAFSQADTTVTREHGGTGLGLTICRRLGELLGGTVRLVRTAPGEGSCFRVELPLIHAPGAVLVAGFEAVSGDRGAAAANKVQLHGRILLAEDGLDNQRLISFHLRKAGATVEIASNGRIAFDMLQAPGAAYDLLLTDMQMPEMDGYTLARKLRASGIRIPIVALTAHAMAEDRSKCTEAGCDDYATKPIDKQMLLTTCARWLVAAADRDVSDKRLA